MNRVPVNRRYAFALIVIGALVLDLYSKQLVFRDLGYPAAVQPLVDGQHQIFEAPRGIEGQSEQYLEGWLTFQLYTSFNEGALWGIGQGYTFLFASLSVLAVIGVIYWLFVRGAATSLWLTIALSLIMGGTLGNLYDRLGWHRYITERGDPIFAVRDFLLFTFGSYHWPVFNFADVFLVTGAIMLVLQSFAGVEAEHDEVVDGDASVARSDDETPNAKNA